MTTTQPPNLRTIGIVSIAAGMSMATIALAKSDQKMTPAQIAISVAAFGAGSAIGGFGVPYLLRKMGI
jgi:hypothetical protein